MKKLLIFFLFLLASIVSYSQIYQFQSEYSAIRLYSHVKQEFNEWEDWEPTNVAIIINTEKREVEIFSNHYQLYKIVSDPSLYREGNKEILKVYCLDIDGGRCLVELVAFQDKPICHLYLRWNNLEVVYQMKKL